MGKKGEEDMAWKQNKTKASYFEDELEQIWTRGTRWQKVREG